MYLDYEAFACRVGEGFWVHSCLILIAVFCAIEPMKNATGVFPIGSLFHGAAGVALLSPIWRPLLDKATGAPVKTRSGRKSRTPKRYQ